MEQEPEEPGAQAALVPVREQTVAFYGDELQAAQTADDQIWVPLRPICDALGLNWSGQRQRLNRDPLWAGVLTECVIHTVQGPRPMLALPLDMLPGWLSRVQASRIKAELQEKILRYQRECFRVLWDAFKADILPTVSPALDLSPAAQALALAEAVASLARQQLGLEQRVDTIAAFTRDYIQHSRRFQAQTDTRLTALELQLSAGATISEAQAAELALAVKNVGQALAAAGDKNGYGKVYAELYRRYNISSYKALPRAQYDAALAWLREWYNELGARPPNEATHD